MKRSRAAFPYFVLLIFIVSGFSYAGVYSWVDENGVRHFSNADGPDGDAVVEERKEHQSAPPPIKRNKRNRPGGIKKGRQKSALDRLLERRRRERAEKDRQEAIEQRQADQCAEAEKQLDELRALGWENHKSSARYSGPCISRDPLKFTAKARAARRACNKLRKQAYENALRIKEANQTRLCNQ